MSSNPYLKEMIALMKLGLVRPGESIADPFAHIDESVRERSRFIASHDHYFNPAFDRFPFLLKYSYAIPDDQVISKIVEFSGGKIIEIGARNGYWASLLHYAGAQVLAYDINPVTPSWFPVAKGTASILKKFPAATLFLCWPPYNESMGADALRKFKGDKLVYIGEGAGGCTADDEFFDMLGNEWSQSHGYAHPQWEHKHDYTFFFTRNSSALITKK